MSFGRLLVERQGWRCVAALLLLAAMIGLAPAAQAQMPPSAMVLPAPAPGMGRIWIYRNLDLSGTMTTPYLRLNGTVIGVSQPGGLIYRDVPPGNYAVTVDSAGTDVNQFVTVPVAAGQQVFVKVLASADWDSGGGGERSGGWARPTFYTWDMQPQEAEAEIARLSAYGHG